MIEDGHTVILWLHDDRSSCMMKVDGEQKLGKGKIRTMDMVGAPYGSIFEVRDHRLVRITDESFTFDDALSGGSGDNSGYIDTNTAQKLTEGDILSLKEEGASGEKIIRSLVENSETWAVKTSYAQEKWLKRKAKKYVVRFRVERCTPASLCSVYHTKSPTKICNMRPDVLAQLLSFSGVFSGIRVMVIDGMVGLLTGSVAYRLRGNGTILSVFVGQQPHMEMVDWLNLGPTETSIIQSIPSSELGVACDDVKQNGFFDRTSVAEIPTTDTDTSSRRRLKQYNSSCSQPDELARSQQILREGADSLIIGTKYHPLPLLQESLPLLSPSSPFVVYCEFLEPLSECFNYLTTNQLAVRLTLYDTWMREFQTLPGRTHPLMHMPTSGGYFLYGIYTTTLSS